MQPWYFEPVLFQLGSLPPIRWYGVMYVLGFLLAYLWFTYSELGKSIFRHPEQKDTLLIASILGVLVGGRIGYVFFYNLPYYLSHPLKIFAVWEGGMSLHGGVIGVGLALWWFSGKFKAPFWKIADLVTSIAPVGLLFGRIGNFINGELYGRVAKNFCLYFPNDPTHCRYPSQLLESFLEGLVLFLLLVLVRKYSKKDGVVTGFFLIFYGLFRIIVEFFREPDVQVGYFWGWVTEGQLLSCLMVVLGVGILVFLKKKSLETR